MRRIDRPSIVLAAAGVVATAAGAVAIAIALSADRTADHLREVDARFVDDPLATELWETSVRWPATNARDALGVDDDFGFRRAVELFRRADPVVAGNDVPPDAIRVRRGRANAALRRHDLGDDEPPRRSQTANLIGVLAMAAAHDGRLVSQPHFERAARHFRRAIVFDPDNDAAKVNLERLLRRALRLGASTGRLEPPRSNRRRQRPEPRRFAGVSPSGRGY